MPADGTNLNLMAATLDMKDPVTVKFRDGTGGPMRAYVVTDKYVKTVKGYTGFTLVFIGDAIIQYTETSYGYVSKAMFQRKYEVVI
jgi:hypothetical protein